MKRWIYDFLADYEPDGNSEWYKADEVDADKAKDTARIQELEEALFQHRADLHCYSSRPCPTCRQSAEVLGIADKVPNGCAKGIWDEKALADT